jgi:hypothetical protein
MSNAVFAMSNVLVTIPAKTAVSPSMTSRRMATISATRKNPTQM